MARAPRAWWPPRPAIATIAALWLLYMAAAGFLIAVDPYDLYPWGVRTILPDETGPLGAAKLIRRAAKDPTLDTVLIGTSPTILYTPAQIRAAFPGSGRAWNASYLRATNSDRLMVLDEFARSSNALHYLVSLDYFYALPLDAKSEFSTLAYDSDPTNDLRMLTPESLRDAWSALRTHRPLYGGGKLHGQLDAVFRAMTGHFHNQKAFAAVNGAIDRYRDSIDRVGKTECAQFPMVAAFARRVAALSARGARVDVVIPVMSPTIFYRWRVDPTPLRLVGPNFLSDQLLMRRCVVLALRDIPNSAVVAPDLDGALSGDVADFPDPGHLGGPKLLVALRNAADPRYRLTLDKFDEYRRRIIADVRGQPHISGPDSGGGGDQDEEPGD